MAITRTQSQITWSASQTLNVVSATEVSSDVVTLDDTTIALSIQVSANTANTPASGDTVVWRIQWTNGDVLANTGDDFDTSEHAQYLTTLDTYSTNTPGENPARRTIDVPIVAKKFKLAATCTQANLRSVSIAARIDEQRAS